MSDNPAVSRQSKVSLREITAETVRTICNLMVTEAQNNFVAPNAVSIAQAYFEPKAWFRAIYADDDPVGFVMLYDEPDKPVYYLWRFMIDAQFQKMGFGRRAIQLLIEYVQSRPQATELLVSYVPAEGGPGPFYHKLGFEPTGEMEGDEEVASLKLHTVNET
jgi:diamine N-acetyltransferase